MCCGHRTEESCREPVFHMSVTYRYVIHFSKHTQDQKVLLAKEVISTTPELCLYPWGKVRSWRVDRECDVIIRTGDKKSHRVVHILGERFFKYVL